MLAIAVLLVVLALAVAFAVLETPTENDTRSATAGLPDLQQELAAHEWLLDRDDSSLTSRDANPVTLVFGEDAISGQGPCNAYRGSAEIDDDDDTVTITDLAQTTRACDPDTERAEREYFDALQHVRDVDLDDAYNAQRLVLDNDSGDRLAFDAIEAAQLLIGTWQVVNVARDDAIESVVDGTDPVLVFAADGEVTLGTGCNPARGSYEVEGDRLSVGALRQTLKSCDEPAGVMDQEVALVRALESGERIEVVPDRLTIIDGDDRITMIAVQEASGQ